jgi:hypothetical protein
MKYKFRGVPSVSKFTSQVMRATYTKLGHIDMEAFKEDDFYIKYSPKAQKIANLGLAHVASFLVVIQYPELVLVETTYLIQCK